MSDVPSNLIPTRLTQLPVAPVADENSLMMIVYQGNNYQIRVGDLLSVAGVPTSRQVIAGTGMTGGGALSSNVTLSIANGGVGSVQLAASGVTSGVYGNATNIPVFTVDSTGRVTAATTIPATISGYVPTSTQVIAGNGLTGGGALSGNVTLAASYSASAPESGFQTGSAGVANTVARSDHKHPAVDLSADDEVDNILGLGNGGTARSIVPAAGAIVWSGADGLYIGPVGVAGQVLVSGGAGAPTWGNTILIVDQPANVVYAGPTAGAAAPTTFRALVNADLPASGVTANTYGSTTAIPVLTVNAKGVITSATTASITGALVYQGAWNALTNTPTLTSSVGVSGYYYVVSVAGTTNLNGITDWQIGDWAIFNGTIWQKIDQTNTVSSVNGQTGAVSIAYADLAGAIPTWNQNTTGTAAGLSTTLAIGSGGTGQTTAGAAFNALSPITTTGDLILGNGANSATRLAIGANGYLLTSNGTTASWVAAPATGVTSFAAGTTGLTPATATTGAVTLAGTLALANGGSGQTTAQAAMNAFAGAVTSGSYLRGNGTNVVMNTIQVADVPTLNQNTTGTAANVTGVVAVANGGTGLSTTPANGELDIGNGTGFTRAILTAGSGVTITNASGSITINATGSGGTVTGVTATSPVASSGGTAPVISLSANYGDTLNPYASKTANYVLAAPNGAAGVPTFRAVVAADIPTLNQNTTGTAAGLSATLAIASGGTGQTTASAAFNALSPITTTGDLILGDGANSATRLAIGANGYLLSSNGTTASWQPAPAGGVTTFAGGTTGLTPASATSGAITLAGTLALANGGSGQTTAQLAMNAFAGAVTSGSYLRGDGTNVVMNTIQVADVPTLNQNTTGTAANVTGIVAAVNGGTGQSSYAVGDLVYASTTTALSKLADVATGNALISGGVGVAPSYGKIGLTTHVSDTLPIANGGTNSTATATAGGAAYGTGTAYAFTAAGTAGQVLTSAGASAPVWGGISGGTF